MAWIMYVQLKIRLLNSTVAVALLLLKLYLGTVLLIRIYIIYINYKLYYKNYNDTKLSLHLLSKFIKDFYTARSKIVKGLCLP
jgi:hypothetical protein